MTAASLALRAGKSSVTPDLARAMIIIGSFALLILTLFLATGIYIRAVRRADRANDKDASELGGAPGILAEILGIDGAPPPPCYHQDEEELSSWRDQMPPARRESRIWLLSPMNGGTRKRLREVLGYYSERGQIDLVDLVASADEASIRELLARIKVFVAKNNFSILDRSPQDVLTSWREQKGSKGPELLRDKKGCVAVRGQFEVTQEGGEVIVLTTGAGSPQEASVSVRIDRKDLRSAGRSMLTPGKKLELICVGQTPGWDYDRQELAIVPVAVFGSASSSGLETLLWKLYYPHFLSWLPWSRYLLWCLPNVRIAAFIGTGRELRCTRA